MPAAAVTIENVDRDEDGLAIQRKARGVLIIVDNGTESLDHHGSAKSLPRGYHDGSAAQDRKVP